MILSKASWCLIAAILAAGCRDEAKAEPNEPAVAAQPMMETIVEPELVAPPPYPEPEMVLEARDVAPPSPTPHEYVSMTIERSLEASFVAATEPRLGAQLTQVTKRVLVWWMDVRRDLRRGDRLEVVYETREDAEPVVHAIWMHSQKLGKPRAAVLFHADGEPFARWYDEEGREIEERLKNSPIESYEQVTSLLRDGRRHKGVDFKAPVGQAIVAPFSGRVLRRNWSRRRNGTCLQIVDDRTKTEAYFLHLDSIPRNIRPGTRVKKGQLLARSGNTGRSTAPHLHYQLEKNGRVVDPFRFHETWRKRLSQEDRIAAQRSLARFGELRTRSM